MSRLGPVIALLIVVIAAGCAEPPHKEMNEAKTAIDAARAAGAERFASDELTAAITALGRSEEAAGGGDYRQALSHAIDGRERAQNAAKLAIEGRARARGEAEAAIAATAALLERAERVLDSPDVSRLPRRTLRGPRDTITGAQNALQKARAALHVEDFDRVAQTLGTTSADLQAVLDSLAAAAAPKPSPRSR